MRSAPGTTSAGPTISPILAPRGCRGSRPGASRRPEDLAPDRALRQRQADADRDHRGSRLSPPSPASVEPAQAVVVIESTPSAVPVAPAPVLAANLGAPAPEPLRPAAEPALSRDEVKAYLVREERMLKDGDVATARLFFARA